MQNQIVVHNQSVQDITAMAQAITKSGLFGIKTPDQAVALMLVAQSEGRHPASVASEFDIIQGRPALKSQAALARFQAAGGKIQWTSRGPSKCSAKFAHAQGGELEITWTMERANAAGLTDKATWRQYPDQMLSARVVAEGVRAVFPACLKISSSENLPQLGNSSDVRKMSAEFAVILFLLCIGSCYACFRLGQENVLHQFHNYCDKRDSSQNKTTKK